MPRSYKIITDLLEIDSLADRRVIMVFILLYGLLFGKITSPYLLSLINFEISQKYTRSHAPFFTLIRTINQLTNQLDVL